MCGIVGYAGHCNHKIAKMFKNMLFFNTVRGVDATGIAMVPEDKTRRTEEDTILYKIPVNAPTFIDTEYGKSLLLRNNNCVAIGHNRKATSGDKSPQNCHPFLYPELVGAHNGTIPYLSLRELKSLPSYGTTDSEQLFNNIVKGGLEETISKISGAWALVWYDYKTREMNFLRNTERPLTYAFSEDGKTLFWASEAWMISGAAERNDVKLRKSKDVDNKTATVFHFTHDKHYRIKVPDYGEFKRFKMSSVKGKSEDKTKAYNHTLGNRGWYKDVTGIWKKNNEEAYKTPETKDKKTATIFEDALPFFSDLYSDPIVLSKQRVTDILSKTVDCAMCGDMIPIDDLSDGKAIASDNDDFLLCKDCTDSARNVINIRRGGKK